MNDHGTVDNSSPVDLDALQKQIKEVVTQSKEMATETLKNIAVDDLVDVQDLSKVWRAAKVTSIDRTQFIVHYLGWGAKFTDKLPIRSARIKQYRTESQIDTSSTTGSYEGAPREVLFELAKVDYNQPKTVNIISNEKPLVSATAKEINLLYRGDFLQKMIEVQKINHHLDEPCLAMANTAYSVFVRMLLELLDLMPSYIVESTVMGLKEKTTLHNHKPSALMALFVDTVAVFELISGCRDGKANWKAVFESNCFIDSKRYGKIYSITSNSQPYQKVCSIVNTFCNKRGLEKIFSLLSFERQCKTKDESGKIHLSCHLLISLLRLMNALTSRMIHSEQDVQLTKLIVHLNEYFCSLSPNFDAVYNDLDKVLICVRYYGGFLKALPPSDVEVMQPEEVKLMYIIHYLSSPVFEKKFTAVNLLKKLIADCREKASRNIQNACRDAMLRNGILKTLYITGYHSEIARKSSDVISFLSPILLADTVEKLLEDAFTHSPEKGGVLCSCVRESVSTMDNQLMFNVLHALASSGKIPIQKIEREAVELVFEIASQSESKTQTQLSERIFEDALMFLWKCLDDQSTFPWSTLVVVVNFLAARAAQSLDHKKKIVKMISDKVQTGPVRTQHLLLLLNIVEIKKGSSLKHPSFQVDELCDTSQLVPKLYEEFTWTCYNPQAKEEQRIGFHKALKYRMQLLLVLMFAGKEQTVFPKILSSLLLRALQKPTQNNNMENLQSIFASSIILQPHNCHTFFGGLIGPKDALAIPDSLFNSEMVAIYEQQARRCLFEDFGRTVPAEQSFLTLIRQAREGIIESLWRLCLTRVVRVNRHRSLLVEECDLIGSENSQFSSSQTTRTMAWKQFEAKIRQNLEQYHQSSNREQFSQLVGNIAALWIEAFQSALGPLYIKDNHPASRTIKIKVRNAEGSFESSRYMTMPVNATGNKLKLRIIEEFCLNRARISLSIPLDIAETYGNSQEIPSKDLNTSSLAGLAEIYQKLWKEQQNEWQLSIVFKVEAEHVTTLYAIRKQYLELVTSDAYFNYFYECLDSDKQHKAWELLSMTPTNPQIKLLIADIPDRLNMTTYVNIVEPMRSRYHLTAIRELITDRSSSNFALKLVASKQADEIFRCPTNIGLQQLEIPNQETAAVVSMVVMGIIPLAKIFTHNSKSTKFVFDLTLADQYFGQIVDLVKYFLKDHIQQWHQNLEEEFTILLAHFEELVLKFPDIVKVDRRKTDRRMAVWLDLLKKGLNESETEAIKTNVANCIRRLVTNRDLDEDVFDQIIAPLYTTSIGMLRVSKRFSSSKEYFLTVSRILEGCDVPERKEKILKKVKFEDIWTKLIPWIETATDDATLDPMFRFMAAILPPRYGKMEGWGEANKHIILSLLERFFLSPTGRQKDKPILRDSHSRWSFMQLLKELMIADPHLREGISSYFISLLSQAKWRKRFHVNWTLQQVNYETHAHEFTGLENLGNTCYMNSIFQQLFMNDAFRDFLIQAPVMGEKPVETVLYQLQKILNSLAGSWRKSYTPKDFCSVFKNVDGSSVNINEQMDADEFFNNLMDKLESQLSQANQTQAIKRAFGGKFIQEIIPKECEHKSSTVTDFLTVSIDVKSFSSIQQSLESLVAGEVLEGENMYSCDNCMRKVKALKRESIKQLPNRLVMALKRFEFNFETLTKHKLNSYCEFPEQLDMRPYSYESIGEHTDDQGTHPEDYFKYKLKGVVIHAGTSDSGHYYSLIKTPDGTWLEFNDTTITTFSFSDMPAIAFGVKQSDEQNIASPPKDSVRTSRTAACRNAYMLIYEREALYDESGAPITTLMAGIPQPISSVEDPGHQQMSVDNFDEHLRTIAVESSLPECFHPVLQQIAAEEAMSKPNEKLVQLCFMLHQVVLVRLNNKDYAIDMYGALKEKISKNLAVSEWYLRNASNYRFFEEFLLDIPAFGPKQFTLGLLLEATKSLADSLEPSSPTLKASGPTSREVDSVMGLLENFTQLCLQTAYKNKDTASLSTHLYRLLEGLSASPRLGLSLVSLSSIETIISLCDMCNNEKAIIEQKCIEPSSIFAGYDPSVVGAAADASLTTIRAEALSNPYFTVDNAPVMTLFFNVIQVARKTKTDPSKWLNNKDDRQKFIRLSTTLKSRRAMSQYFVSEVNANPSFSEKLLLDIKALSRNTNLGRLKTCLFLLRQLLANCKSVKTRELTELVTNLAAADADNQGYLQAYKLRILRPDIAPLFDSDEEYVPEPEAEFIDFKDRYKHAWRTVRVVKNFGDVVKIEKKTTDGSKVTEFIINPEDVLAKAGTASEYYKNIVIKP